MLIAAACLLSFVNVFASDHWTSPSETAFFQLGVYCDPALNGGTSHNLGTYFTEQSGLIISSADYTLTWYLTGPSIEDGSGVGYQLFGTGQNAALLQNNNTDVEISSTGGTDGESLLHGYWQVPVLSYPGSPVHCATGNTDCVINFVPTSMDSHGTGDQTFDISLSVTVTL